MMHCCPGLMHHEAWWGVKRVLSISVAARLEFDLQRTPKEIVTHSAGWATLVENIMDPAHVNFSHHNVIGNRYLFTSCSLHTCAPPPHVSCPLHARNAHCNHFLRLDSCEQDWHP